MRTTTDDILLYVFQYCSAIGDVVMDCIQALSPLLHIYNYVQGST